MAAEIVSLYDRVKQIIVDAMNDRRAGTLVIAGQAAEKIIGLIAPTPETEERPA